MIIAINGRIDSGKDVTGRIIQYLTSTRTYDKTFIEWEAITKTTKRYYAGYSAWEIKKFADKLKDIVCLLIGCTRDELEDHDFKNKELGEEWWKYTYTRPNSNKIFKYFSTSKEAHQCMKAFNNKGSVGCIKLTPRLLLQLLGTEYGRNIIHPNIWVNSLMSEYKSKKCENYGNCLCGSGVFSDGSTGLAMCETEKPKWIITDLRFPNEMEAIKERKGITIRINRPPLIPKDFEHESETSLDSSTFDYEINNNGSLEDLIGKVKEILIKEKII